MAEAIQAIQSNLAEEGVTEITGLSQGTQETTPFGEFMNQALQALDKVQQSDIKANQAMQAYASGQISMDEALIIASRASLDVQKAVNITNQLINTFKEIQQIQV